MNANKTSPRTESNVEKEGGEQWREREKEKDREREKEGDRKVRRESERKARLDRSRDRGAYAVEEEISKRISLSSLLRVSNYAP